MQEKKSKNFKIKKINIVGVITSYAFQRAKYCALELHKKLPMKFPQPEILGLLELDWNEKLIEWRQTIGREYWCLRRPVAVFFDDKFIGSDIELIKLISIGNILLENIPRKNSAFLRENFRKEYIAYLTKSKRVYCYLDICIDELFVGTLTFQLFSDLVPRTCQNFESLCLGNRGPLLTYKGSQIHRIVKEGWLQGGDIQYKTGGGGFSIFCDPFEDEGFGISHDRRGILSMANRGRNTNESQFLITLRPSTWMDVKYVAFGQLIEGVYVLKLLENLETFYEKPVKKVEIKNCGKLEWEEGEEKITGKKKIPTKLQKLKKFETISQQIMRLILEAVTEALARKEHAVDVLDDGDVPSKMNIQLYFQGFYSIPENILEGTARYLRKLRRELFRELKPSATQIAEAMAYDLLTGIFSRMVTLDEIKNTIGSDFYQTMIEGIDMNFDLCKKPYLKRMIDQIITTAENMIGLIIKKLTRMKRMSEDLKQFKEQMQNWVQSFVLQETFKGDRYHIALRPGWEDLLEEITGEKKEKTPEKKLAPRTGTPPCCEIEEKERKKKEKLLIENMKKKYRAEDICCIGSKIFEISRVKISDYFSTCRYELKRVPKFEKERMPLLDLIEYNRYQLKFMRKQENRTKTKNRICIEKRIRKWMDEVAYTSETLWIRDLVFGRNDLVFDHVEEIMYGAMTAGLLEMYYFMEKYLKLCGKKKQMLVTKTIHPYRPKEYRVGVGNAKQSTTVTETTLTEMTENEEFREEEDTFNFFNTTETKIKQKESSKRTLKSNEYKTKSGALKGSTKASSEDEEKKSEGKTLNEKDKKTKETESKSEKSIDEKEVQKNKEGKPPCLCGHPCCVCEFDPFYNAPAPPPSLAEEEGEEKEKEEEGEEEEEREGEVIEKEGDEEKEKEAKKVEGDGKEEKGKDIKEEGEETDLKKKISEEHPDNTTERMAKKVKPCASDETLIDLNAILAEKTSLHPEEIDIRSFNWLKPYILEEGCDLKTDFATDIHKWLEGERIDITVFTSKQSLVTRASILSLSLSLAELIKDENKMKKDIRNFIYDLWDLYFKEMFKEALLEFPPEEKKVKKEKEKKEELPEKDSEYDSDNKAERKQTIVSILSEKKKKLGDIDKRRTYTSQASDKTKSKEDGDKHTIVSILDEREKVRDSDDDESSESDFNDSESRKKSKKKVREKEAERKSKESKLESGKRSEKSESEDTKSEPESYKKSRESELLSKKSKENEFRDKGKSKESGFGSSKKSKESEFEDKKKSKESRLGNSKKSKTRQFKERRKNRENDDEDEREIDEDENKKETMKSRESKREDKDKSEEGEDEIVETIKEKRAMKEQEEGSSKRMESSSFVQSKRKESKTGSLKKQSDSQSQSSKTFTSHSTTTFSEEDTHHEHYSKVSSSAAYSGVSQEKSRKTYEGASSSYNTSEKVYNTSYNTSSTLSQPISDYNSGRFHHLSHGSEKRSARIIEEVVSVTTIEETRNLKNYTQPFWIKFLTELTKQALGALAKISRLPRRLYYRTDSELKFDDKIHEWFEFNAFNPQPTKGRELMDYIAAHHKSLLKIEDSVRGYLKKKKYSELMNRCSRITSADDMANNIIANVVDNALTPEDESKTVELFVSNMLVDAATSSPQKSEFSIEENAETETELATNENEDGNDADEDDDDAESNAEN